MKFLGMLIFVILFLWLMNHVFAFVAKWGEKAADVIEGKQQVDWHGTSGKLGILKIIIAIVSYFATLFILSPRSDMDWFISEILGIIVAFSVYKILK